MSSTTLDLRKRKTFSGDFALSDVLKAQNRFYARRGTAPEKLKLNPAQGQRLYYLMQQQAQGYVKATEDLFKPLKADERVRFVGLDVEIVP